MNIEDKLYIESLDGFLGAVSIVKSPERNIFYSARYFENKSIKSGLNSVCDEIEDEMRVINEKNLDTDLRWIYPTIKNELSSITNEEVRFQLVENIFYYFENLFDDDLLTEVVEYDCWGKIDEADIDYYCEFNDRRYAFQKGDDVIVMSFSYRIKSTEKHSSRIITQ